MNPQNYNNPEENQPSSQSAQEWFNNIDAPAITTTPPSSPKRSSKKPIIIAACILSTVILLLAAAYFFIPAAKACLNAQNYQELFGVESQEAIDAKTNFYTAAVEFDPGSSDYDESTEQDTKKLISSIGSLYKNHHESSSMVVSLSADYIYEDAATIATERIEKIKASLIEAGVEASAITVTKPALIPLETDYSSDDMPARISITSGQDCRE